MITTTYTCDLKECGKSVAVDSNNGESKQPEEWKVIQYIYMEGYYVSCCSGHLEAIVRERVSNLKRGDLCVLEQGHLGQFIDLERAITRSNLMGDIGRIYKPIGLLNENGRETIDSAVSGGFVLMKPLSLEDLDLVVQKLEQKYDPGSSEETFMADISSLDISAGRLSHSEVRSYLSRLESFDFYQFKIPDLITLVRFNQSLRDSIEESNLELDQKIKTAKRIYRIFDAISSLDFGKNQVFAPAVDKSRQCKRRMCAYYGAQNVRIY